MWGIVRIAFRNTRRQLKRSILLGGAIAFGVMIITLLNGFTSGAIGNIKDNFSYAAGGHIFITGTELTDSLREVDRISDHEALDQVIDRRDPRIVSVHRRSMAFMTLIFGSKAATQLVEGVDFSAEADLSKGLQVRAGSLDDLTDPRALIVPAPTAEKLGVMVGETVLARLQTVTGQQNVGEFRIVAIIEDPMGFGMTSAYGNLHHVNELIGLRPDEYQTFHIFLRDMKHIDAIADHVHDVLFHTGAPVERPYADMSTVTDFEEESRAALGQMFGQVDAKIAEEPWEGTKFSIVTLNDMMQPIVSAMAVLDAIALGIFIILLLITSVGIMNTFRMILIERTREIGTMRAFGMQRRTVRSIFLWEAAMISLGGGGAGLALAGAMAFLLSRFTFSNLQGLEFFLEGGHITFAVTGMDLITNVAVLLVMSLLAALLPANAAARLQPVEALNAQH